VRKSPVIVCLALAAVAFYLANRYAAEVAALEGPWILALEAAMPKTAGAVCQDPLSLSLDRWPLLVGFCAFVTVGMGLSMAFMVPRPERVGEEHGSGRWGTAAEAARFKLPRRRARRRQAVDAG
jgi:hypothetical protein